MQIVNNLQIPLKLTITNSSSDQMKGQGSEMKSSLIEDSPKVQYKSDLNNLKN